MITIGIFLCVSELKLLIFSDVMFKSYVLRPKSQVLCLIQKLMEEIIKISYYNMK